MLSMDYWLKQDKDTPLFPDLLWSRPENRQRAGKLLIIGGNKFHFSAPGQAYTAATAAGAGSIKVLLPDALKKTIGRMIENCEYAPTNKSGSFARSALDEWLTLGGWADTVLLAGDIGRNSETAIVLEAFVKEYTGPLVVTQDCLDVFTSHPQILFQRPKTTVVAAFGQLQKMWPHLHLTKEALLYTNPIHKNIELLHEASQKSVISLLTKQNEDLIVAVIGQISTTPHDTLVWRVDTAARAAVWFMQNPAQPFAAINCALIEN